MGYTFNGTDQWVRWPVANVPYPITISLWFKPTVTNAANDYMYWQGRLNEAGDEGFRLSTRGTGDVAGFGANASGGTSWAETTNTITAGTWHHVVGIGTSTTNRRCVLDGDWANSGTSTTSKGTTAFVNRMSVGARADDNPTNFFPGDIAELAIWTTALEQGEVEALAEGLSPLRIHVNSLDFYAPLIDRFTDLVTTFTPETS